MSEGGSRTTDSPPSKQEETLAYGIGRVRDVRQGPDGYVYLAVEHPGRRGQVVRLEPVDGR